MILFHLGAFPLSDVSLMTDAERRQFLPVTRTFVSVLEKDKADPEEINLLVEQSKEINNLIPDNLKPNVVPGWLIFAYQISIKILSTMIRHKTKISKAYFDDFFKINCIEKNLFRQNLESVIKTCH